jgi:hypothetical protein
MDDEKLVSVQQRDCLLKGELEYNEILNCKKTKSGLLFVLEITGTALNNHKRLMFRYPLINYDGVQLKLKKEIIW